MTSLLCWPQPTFLKALGLWSTPLHRSCTYPFGMYQINPACTETYLSFSNSPSGRPMRSLFGGRLSCGSISMYKAHRQIYGQSLETPPLQVRTPIPSFSSREYLIVLVSCLTLSFSCSSPTLIIIRISVAFLSLLSLVAGFPQIASPLLCLASSPLSLSSLVYNQYA